MKSFVLFLWVIITLNYNSHIGTTSDESNTNWLTLVTKYTMFQKENKTLFIELVGSIKKYKNFFFTLNSNNPYLINKESQGFFVSSYAKGLMLLNKIIFNQRKKLILILQIFTLLAHQSKVQYYCMEFKTNVLTFINIFKM